MKRTTKVKNRPSNDEKHHRIVVNEKGIEALLKFSFPDFPDCWVSLGRVGGSDGVNGKLGEYFQPLLFNLLLGFSQYQHHSHHTEQHCLQINSDTKTADNAYILLIVHIIHLSTELLYNATKDRTTVECCQCEYW